MDSFRILVFTPTGLADPSVAIAACRAGEIGILDAECLSDPAGLRSALDGLARHGRAGFGVRLGTVDEKTLEHLLQTEGLGWLVVEPEQLVQLDQHLARFRDAGGQVLAEIVDWRGEYAELTGEIDGWVVKGHEAGGVVGEETSFILLQKVLAAQDKAVHVRGGIGMHSAAGCVAAGASGVALDSQLLLMRESSRRERLKSVLKGLVGTETVQIGDPGQGRYLRLLDRPGFSRVKSLKADEAKLDFEDLRKEFMACCGWDSTERQVLPVGQDVAFALDWAQRYKTVGGALAALRRTVTEHLEGVGRAPCLVEDNPLAVSHGTRYPIVQGPMTRVSDTAAFAEAVARGGALPMLALALMRGDAVRALLKEATERLAGLPWGVGMLGFAPAELLAEQIAISREFKPAFALLAGGRPDQAVSMEQLGIPSYLHVPSPRLLSMFLDQGARRFVFEGRECGGHIGPLSSLVLWESMIQTLLDRVSDPGLAGEIHILFAGGIHDARSAAAVSAMASPLAARGMKIGVLMGSAYLFTREIVAAGSIVPTFQEEAIACQRTVSLETGTGHASRCADTPFAQYFLGVKRQMLQEGKSADEIREALEELNLGRLRVASKGKDRSGPDGRIQAVDAEQQRQDGMYMIGQVATMMREVIGVADLHERVTRGAADFIRDRLQAMAADRSTAQGVTRPADIAIVGIGCVLPKAGNARQYWENILDRVDGITEIPAHRWDWRLYFDPDRNAQDKIYSRWGGFLDDMVFDPLRYGIPPRALKAVDTMQLMTLEVVRQTLEDAGYADRDYPREKVSIILGASGGVGDVGAQYAVRSETPRFAGELSEDVARRLPVWTEDSFAGILMNVAAGRAANRFDFGGVNFTVDAACASSLTAVYQAVAELVDGHSDMVIAGGVDTVQGPFGYLCFSKTQALSPRGRCSTFDQAADGIVISEGIAMLALKRLADAERDGDRIYAVIKGVGGSSDGRARSMTAPHPDGQIRALQRAYAQAGYSPASVELFEAHGTGTVAGDTAELETVTRLLKESGAPPKSAVIGSVKTLIGHTKATAGVAGLAKAALALYHRTLPPHANVTRPNTKVAAPDSPLYLLSEAKPWIAGEHPRRAGVSAFGFGGTNFHVALEEYQDDYLPEQKPAVMDSWHGELLVLRRADRAELAAELGRLSDALRNGAHPVLHDLAYSLWRALPEDGQTACIVAGEMAKLPDRLAQFATHLQDPAKPLPPGCYYSTAPLGADAPVAVLFAGQGVQYPNMLRQVAMAFPDIGEVLALADRLLAEPIARAAGPGRRLSDLIYPPALFSAEDETAAAEALTRTQIAQPALGAVEVGLWRTMQRFGVKADMVAGHSYGEYVALHVAGVFGLEDLLRLSEARGRSIIEATEGADLGGMAAVQAERAAVEAVAKNYPDLLVANHNAPLQSILSGSKASLAEVVARYTAEGIKAKVLPVAAAFHSGFVAPARERLAGAIAAVEMSPPAIPVYSNTTARPYPQEIEAIRHTLVEHLTSPVEFVAQIEAMYEDGARIFLGAGPKTVPESLVDQILAGRRHRVVRVDDHEGGLKGLLHGLGALMSEGLRLDLEPLFRGRDCRLLDLADLSKDVRAVTVPAHAWVINGTQARPLGAPPLQPLTLEEVQTRRKTADVNSPAPSAGPFPAAPLAIPAVAASQQIHMHRKEHTVSENPPRHPLDTPPPSTGGEWAYYSAGGREAVLSAYQQVMRDFLQVQESVMLAYLVNGSGAHARVPELQRRAAPIAMPRAVPVPAAIPPVTQTAPAAPAPMAAPPLAPVPAAQPTPAAAAPTPAPAAKPAPAPAAAPAAAKAAAGPVDVGKLLLSIVEDRTGYPQDMLGLDLNMEADLGIDSIKRVEIVGALIKALPEAMVQTLGDAAGTLNQQKTLGGIIATLSSQAKAEAAHPFELTGTGELQASRAPLPRFVMRARQEDLAGVAPDPLAPGLYLITDDGLGVARRLADLLCAAGATPYLLPADRLASREVLLAALAEARPAGQAVRGLIHLAPLSGPLLDLSATLDDWRGCVARNEKSLFWMLQALAPDLQAGGRILAASALGGLFGRQGYPANGLNPQGGFVGMLKSVNDEWPEVRVKALDLDPAQPAEAQVEAVWRELRLPGGRIEVGYPQGQRTIFQTEAAPLQGAGRDLRPGKDWVILSTGGARGITAEVLGELAKAGLRLILVGRSPEPHAETAETAALTDAQALRAHLLNVARTEGRPAKPVEIEREVSRILRDREFLANLRDFRAAGAEVEYRVADVRSATDMATLLDDIYRRHGRLDGVVHGAGIIEDKLLTDKTVESWERVLDTKVDSAFLLAKHLRPETLKFLVFFTSVAGRYGNTGQTDYATANELVNRLACQLHHLWQGRVKVAAINWGPWLGTRHGKGMVSPETRRKFESKGVVLVDPEGGQGLFNDEVLRAPTADVEVIAGGGPWESHEAEMGTLRATAPAAAEPAAEPGLAGFPLLAGATRHAGPRGEVILRRTLSLASDPYLAQHTIDDIPVLPAAVALELMAETAAVAWPGWVVNEMSEVRMLKGIRLTEPTHALDLVALASSHGDATGFEAKLEIRPAGAPGPVYYRATAHMGSTPLESLEYQSLLAPEPTSVTPKTAYKELLFHGPCLQTLHKFLAMNRQGALAEVHATAPDQWLPGARDHWLFDPSLVDSGPQMALIWAHMVRSESALPSRFGRVSRYVGGGAGPYRMHFIVHPDAHEQQVKADVAFVDQDMRLVLLIEAMECTSSQALSRIGGGWKGEIRV